MSGGSFLRSFNDIARSGGRFFYWIYQGCTFQDWVGVMAK